MNDKVKQLKPCANAPLALRNIADRMESGDIFENGCTIIAGSDVFHCGEYDNKKAAESAVFNMTMGIHKLIKPVFDNE